MLPIGTINLYISFIGASDPADPLPGSIPLAGPYGIDDARTIVERIYADTEPLPISEEDCARSSDLEDDADSAVPAPIARSRVTPASEARSIAAASTTESITLVSNASAYAESVYSLLEDESVADPTDLIHDDFPRLANVFIARAEENDEPDPFTTPLQPNATAQQIEDHRRALDAAKKKELAERNKFRLE